MLSLIIILGKRKNLKLVELLSELIAFREVFTAPPSNINKFILYPKTQ